MKCSASAGGGVGRDVLHGGGVRRVGRDHDGVVHRVVVAQRLDDGRHLPGALSDRAVDADDVGVPLVDDRVDRDGRLAGLAVADDQLALAAPDRDHRVDRLDPGLERLLHRLPLDDPGRDHVDLAPRRGLDRAGAVERGAQRVDHAALVAVADGDVQDASGAPHLVTLVQPGPLAQDDRADVVLFQVQRERRHRLAALAGGDLEHLVGHRLRQPVDARHPVLHLENLADLLGVERLLEAFDFGQEDALDLARPQL